MPTRRTFLETGATALWVPHFCRVFCGRSGDVDFANPSSNPGAPLLAGVARSGGFDFPPTKSSEVPPHPPFPVHDYHVHLSNTLTIDQALALAKDRGVQVGILEHPGPGFPINTDADLQRYIDNLRKYPVRIGLQPVYPGMVKSLLQACPRPTRLHPHGRPHAA